MKKTKINKDWEEIIITINFGGANAYIKCNAKIWGDMTYDKAVEDLGKRIINNILT